MLYTNSFIIIDEVLSLNAAVIIVDLPLFVSFFSTLKISPHTVTLSRSVITLAISTGGSFIGLPITSFALLPKCVVSNIRSISSGSANTFAFVIAGAEDALPPCEEGFGAGVFIV